MTKKSVLKNVLDDPEFIPFNPQKERDHLKEAKEKVGDLRATVHILRLQKREVERRIIEMQSTVSSLRDEQKTMESALEEKQNEIKMMLRDRRNIPAVVVVNPQVSEETEDDLQKNNAKSSSVNVWSVSTDDPSNDSVNSETRTSTAGRDELNNFNVNSKEHADNSIGGASGEQGEVRRENGGETAEIREIMTEELSQKQDNSKESNTQEGIVEGKGEEKETSKAKGVGNHGSEVQRRHRDETNERHATGDKVTETAGNGMLGSNAQDAENQELGANLKGGMKIEMLDNVQIGRHRRKGKSSYLKRTRGRRWTIMNRGKLGNSENNGVAGISYEGSLKNTSAETLDISEPQKKSSSMINETSTEDPELKISDNLKKGDASDHEDSRDMGQEAKHTSSYIQMEEKGRINGTSGNAEMVHISLKDGSQNMTVQTDDSRESLEGEQSVHEIGLSKKQTTAIQAEEMPLQKEDGASDFDEEPNDPEIEDLQEQDSETETSNESIANSETDEEEGRNK